RQKRVARVTFVVRGQGEVPDLAQAVAEGLTLAEFHAGTYKTYKTDDPGPGPVPAWTIAFSDQTGEASDRASTAVERGRILGECSNLSRELANEPGNTLTPTEFARRAAALARDAG